MVSPTIEKIAHDFKEKLLTIKVNVDDKSHIAAQYQIQSIPTIMLFHKGKMLMRLTGALQYETLKAEIRKNLV